MKERKGGVKIVQTKLQLQNTFQHFRTKVNTSVKSIFSEEVSPRRTLAGPPSSSDESLPSSWISDVCLLLDIFFFSLSSPGNASTDIPIYQPYSGWRRRRCCCWKLLRTVGSTSSHKQDAEQKAKPSLRHRGERERVALFCKISNRKSSEPNLKKKQTWRHLREFVS